MNDNALLLAAWLLLLSVPPHHWSLGKSQPQPASNLCPPPALPIQQLLAGPFPA